MKSNLKRQPFLKHVEKVFKIKLNCHILGNMASPYTSAVTELEKILRENAKEISSDEKNKLTFLVKDLKAEMQKKKDLAGKFSALEKSLKRSKPALSKQIEEIRKSLVDGSMSIVGTANISIPSEQKASEAEYALQLLDELHKQAAAVIEKTDTSTKAETTKGGKGKGKLPMKLESHQVSDKFKSVSSVLTEMGETIMEAEHTSNLLDQLYKQATAVNGDQVKKQTEMSKKDNKTKSNKRKDAQDQKKMETDHVLKHEDKFESILSALKKMDEANKEAEHTSDLLDQLYKQANAVNGGQVQKQTDKTEKDSKSKGKERKDVQVKKTPETDIVLKHDEKFESVLSVLKKVDEAKKEAEYTSDLLDQLYKQATAVNGDQVQKQTDMSKKDNESKGKERKDVQVQKKTEKDNVLKHDEKFKSVSSVLKKMDETNNDVSKLKYEIECLAEMLDELKKTVSEGGKEPITLSASAETKDEPQAYKSARQILQKFKEKEILAEHATDLLDGLYKQSVLFTRNQVDENTKDAASLSKLTDKQKAIGKTKVEAETRTPLDAYSMLDKRCKVVSSALNKLQEMEGEADHASKLLDQLYKLAFAVNVDQVKEQTDKQAKDKPLKGGKGKEEMQDQTKQESYVVSNHEEKYKSISSALMKLEKANKDAQHHDEQKHLLQAILDDLFEDVHDLVEGRTNKTTQSALDQRRKLIDEEKESLTYSWLQHAKLIYEIQVDLKREAEYAACLLNELKNFATIEKEGLVTNILSKPPKLPSRGERKEDHQGKETNPNQSKKLVGGNPSSVQLNQNYENASAVVHKQIEAQYAARLLDELSKFSQTTIDSEDRNILSDPPVETEQNSNTVAETSKIESQQIQHNKRPSTHFEKASAILGQIKEKQKLLIEKNHLEDELKNLQATIDLYVSDIKNSERKNVSLQEDTERGTKQLEERLRKLQHLNIENSEMKKEINHLRTRLSEIAGAKLTHENPSIADLSDPNRATKLAEKYSELYDNQWTDAFSALSKCNDGASDKELTGYLYDILIDGYRFCASVRLRQKKSIEVIMLHPDVNVESSQGRQTEKVNEMFSKLLSDAAKMTSNMTSVNMVKTFLENDEMQKKYGKMMTPCKEYIEECVKLCWLMQVQTPPVYMDLKTAKKQAFQKDTYREYTSKGKYIDFVVWPALFLHEGGPLLAKGIAQGK